MVRLVNAPAIAQPLPRAAAAETLALSEFDTMIELMERSLERSLDDEAYIRWALEVVLEEQRRALAEANR
jgi:hypothetical protein